MQHLRLFGAWALVLWMSSAVDGSVPVAAQKESFERDRAKVIFTFVGQLGELGLWCQQKKLYLERDRIYALLLEYDPEHVEARRMLKHEKDEEGRWHPSPDYREPTNRNPKALEEFPDKLADVKRSFANSMLLLIKAHESEIDPALRRSIYDQVLHSDPNEPHVHELIGDVRMEDRWVLPETKDAVERRALLKSSVERGIAEAPELTRVEPTAEEAALGIEWKAVIATPRVRVLGTGDVSELERAAKASHAVETCLRAWFDCETPLYEGYTIYVLTRSGDKQAFLDHHPAVTPENRSYLASLIGSGVPGTANVVVWDEDPARRLDLIVRHTVGGFLRDTFSITTDHGWAWEGLGIYITWRILGTRLNWYVQPSDFVLEDGKRLRPRLLEPEGNWMNEAYQVLRSPKRPDLLHLMESSVTDMRIEEMLCSYALAAYLVEGRPRETPELLRRIGGGEEPAIAIQHALGFSMDQFTERLLRWLGERR